jgi:hypothetical protein
MDPPEAVGHLRGKKLCGFKERYNHQALPAGFEPATLGLEGPCSDPLSYGSSLPLRHRVHIIRSTSGI